ncbi:hypothetical protein C1752_01250 [Acaryochloris thomasi RCC1774]|uniref:Acyltransferase 3 domain-containing protein n=2 Tax=Acaryochloris TaxID=155977 RepID=A0A2W1JLS2_9CYAN|nr:hypothetical protein C1752_01250 [Acaryochloris thomasi RCC1774]
MNVGGFANVIVSVFFLLSGYGIFASVRKKVIKDFSIISLVLFFRDRLVRLFPLYWIALAAQMLVNHEPYQVSDFLGIGAEGHYWFISAILQCYLLSPFLAYALDRKKYLTLFGTTLVFIGVYFLPSHYPFLANTLGWLHFVESPYLDIYFLHTYLFFLGMSLQKLELIKNRTQWESKIPKSVHCTIFLLIFILICFSVLLDKVYSFPVFGTLILVIAWTIYALRNGIEIKFFAFLGRISFSVYLFHMTYYFLLAKIGVLKIDLLWSVVAVIIVSPAFVLLCLGLERFGNDVARKLKKVGA